LRLGLSAEGLRHTAVESAESPRGCHPTAPHALSLFDSPLLRLAWLNQDPAPDASAGGRVSGDLDRRGHPLFTLPAIGIAAYRPTQIGTSWPLLICLPPPAPIIRRAHIGLWHLIPGVSHQASKQPPRRACLFGLAGDEIGERL
jgi:hypothetical protein